MEVFLLSDEVLEWMDCHTRSILHSERSRCMHAIVAVGTLLLVFVVKCMLGFGDQILAFVFPSHASRRTVIAS